MFNRKIFEFNIEPTGLEQYVGSEAYASFKKYIKNYIVNSVNKGEYEKVDIAKDILSGLIVLEKNKKSLDNKF